MSALIIFNNSYLLRARFRVEPCGDACKNQRQQLEADCEQLRHDLADAEESKKTAEQKSRDFEQEVSAPGAPHHL